MPGKEGLYITQEQLNNRFINYYILKWLWIRYKTPVPQLYESLFSKNKTLYDRVLRLGEFDVQKAVAGLDKKTGLHIDYFLGVKAISITTMRAGIWQEFIDTRAKRRKTVTQDAGELQQAQLRKLREQIQQLEDEISKGLESALEKLDQQSQAFRSICYFAKNKNTLGKAVQDNRIEQVMRLMEEFSKKGLEKVEGDYLEQYATELQKHLDVVRAVKLLKSIK